MEENIFHRFNTKSGFFDLRFHEVKKMVAVNKDLSENPILLKALSELYKQLVKSYYIVKAFESEDYMEELKKIDFSSDDTDYATKLNEFNALYAVRNCKMAKAERDKNFVPKNNNKSKKPFQKKEKSEIKEKIVIQQKAEEKPKKKIIIKKKV